MKTALNIFGKKAIVAAFIIVVAEICWRLGRFLVEAFYKSKYYPYDKKIRTAFLNGFTFSTRTYILLGVLGVSLTQQNFTTIFEGILEQLHLLPLWLALRYALFTQCKYDISDLIRSNSGIDIASGMAASYYHAYLRVVLPRNEHDDGIVQRIETYESHHQVQFAIKRLFILFPNSLHGQPVFESPLLNREEGQPLRGFTRDRGGVARPYSNSVYRIRIDDKSYYITMEMATPLVSYFESIHFGLSTTTIMKEMVNEIKIKFYRYLHNILENWPETKGKCELVYYNDYTVDGQPQDVGELLCDHIKNLWEKRPDLKPDENEAF